MGKSSGNKGWFQPLNPYKHDVPIFNQEKVNFRLKDYESGETTKEREPLYCLAVSAKRYCLFNRDKYGEPIIRKASAHGLGDVMLPTGYEARFEHYAASIGKDGTRQHSKLVAGSAAPLFLDMWYAAITELGETGSLDRIDEITWPELDVPQHSQTSLSTRDAWLHYQSLPNRRAFQFMTTLPAPVQNMFKMFGEQPPVDMNGKIPPAKGRLGTTHDSVLITEFEAAQKSSLYAPFTKPFKLDLNELYRRDTNELIKPYLDVGLELQTVAQRIKGYFAHGEAKSQGSVGLLKRKCVAGLSKVWIGKESHPLADVEDLPDDEMLEHYLTDAEIIAGGLNHDLIVQAGIEKVAAAARVDEIALVDAVLTQKALPEDVITRIKAAIVINPDTSIEVVTVPKTRQETAMDRLHRILNKEQHICELEKFIHATSETGFTHEQILHDLANVGGSKVNPHFLTLAEIELFAKQFYGFTARVERKLAKDQKQAALFAKTAHNARARRDKSRAKKRSNEIERVAEFWGLPEITKAKTVKHAHLIDKYLTQIAETGAEPIEIVFCPYLHPVKKFAE